MFHADVVKVLTVLLVVYSIESSHADDTLTDDLQRTKPEKRSQYHITSESNEESPHVYQEHQGHYHAGHHQEEEEDDKESHPEPQRISHAEEEQYVDERKPHYDPHMKEPQAYKFGYEVKDNHQGHQFRHESKDEKGNIHGRFGYRDSKGQYRQVNYVADDHGFRAKVRTNEPGIVDDDPADVDIHKDEEIEYQEQHGADTSGSENTYKNGDAPKPEHHSRQAVMEDEPEDEDMMHVGEEKESDHMHYDSQMYQPYSTENQRDEQYKYDKSRQGKRMQPAIVYRRYFKMPKPYDELNAPKDEHIDEHEIGSYKIRKEHSRKPEAQKYSTYQYELQPPSYKREHENMRNYKPSHEDQYYQEHAGHRPEYVVEHAQKSKEEEHEVPPLSLYDAYRTSHPERENMHQQQEHGLILPQTAEYSHGGHMQEIEHHRVYEDRDGYHGNDQGVADHDHNGVIKEYRIKYEQQTKPPEKVIPAIHQYIQIINEQDVPNSAAKDNVPYGHKHVLNDKTPIHSEIKVAGQPNVLLQYAQNPESYREQSHIHQSNSGVNLPPYTAVPQNHQDLHKKKVDHILHAKPLKEQHAGQQAVLEINADVYKDLFNKKSPQQQLVAIPVSSVHGSANKVPSNMKPHGILHIPLENLHHGHEISRIVVKQDQTQPTNSVQNKPQFHLNIGNGQRDYSGTRLVKPQEHIIPTKYHVPYKTDPHSSVLPENGKYIRDKDYSNSKWIPMTPTWKQNRHKNYHKSQTRAESAYAPTISSTEMLKFKPNESVIDIQRKSKDISPAASQKQNVRYIFVSSSMKAPSVRSRSSSLLL